MKSLLITKAFFIAAVSLARAGTMTDLGALPGGNYATANSLSPDGSVVIGISSIATRSRTSTAAKKSVPAPNSCKATPSRCARSPAPLSC